MAAILEFQLTKILYRINQQCVCDICVSSFDKFTLSYTIILTENIAFSGHFGFMQIYSFPTPTCVYIFICGFGRLVELVNLSFRNDG